MNVRRHRSSSSGALRQRGVVLIVAVIVMVAMTLAAYAMLRAVGGSMGVAGNLSFRQNATLAADAGVEEAMKWMLDTANVSKRGARDAVVTPFYYPTWDTSFDPFTFNWDDAAGSSPEIGVPGGNQVKYVVHRMCSNVGDVGASGTQKCVLVPKKYVVEAMGCKPDEDPACGTGNVVYFRVTTRVTGPRNTVSYVQVLMF